MELLDVLWSIFVFFLFFAWIMLLFSIFADLFRRGVSGWAKAGWTVFLIALPLVGALIYLVANGSHMHVRQQQQAALIDQAQREYIREAAGTSRSTADELSRLAELRDAGVLTDDEFRAQKARVMAQGPGGAAVPAQPADGSSGV